MSEKNKATLLLVIRGPHAEALEQSPFLLRNLSKTLAFAMWAISSTLAPEGCWADYEVSIEPQEGECP
jgi:hypothetical protein